MHLDLDIWEMTATYFGVNAGPGGTVFPSMWFQFAEDEDNQSRLFYGFPVLPWGPPNLARISVDAATRQIKDPEERQTNVINPQDVANVQKFIEERVVGVDHTVPAYSLTCLQTNVFGELCIPATWCEADMPASKTTCLFLTSSLKSILLAAQRILLPFLQPAGR
jgi:sarcosine oxidase/L-pipecolate oxidase